ncbi:MAG: chromosomal replication initiator protein DnaA [candidate division WOR-3 bacterium]
MATEKIGQQVEGGFTDAARVWRGVLDLLRTRVRREGFETWLSVTSVRSMDGSGIEIEVPNGFFADWIAQHYATDIRAALQEVTNQDLAISFVARDALKETGGIRQRESRLRPPAVRPEPFRLQARYSFENFVVGESNRFAFAAAQSVAERPGQRFNPLFIYGGVGLGKTHLLQAIGNYALGAKRVTRVHYTPAEALFTELIQAIASDTRLDFKNKYRNLDLLLLDDIHYLVGKERLQEEVFHIFNHLHAAGSQVVFTSDRPPKDLPNLEERLVSRLGSGLVVDIQPPDLETRMAILKRKAACEQAELPEDVAYLIATRIKHSVRALEGALIRLLAVSSLAGKPLTVAMAEQALKDLIRVERPTDHNRIIAVVAEQFGISPQELRGTSRTKQFVLARQVAMFLMRTKLNLSLKEIGGYFGGKDHTTVMHALEKVERLRAKDTNFAARLQKVCEALNGG